MITLCNDLLTISEALESVNNCDCLKEIIKIYLESYGTDYDFNQFFIQYNDNHIPIAVFHRYNSKLHLICNNADFDELFAFLSGFADCELIANADLSSVLSCSNECFVMTKIGEKSSDVSFCICDYSDAKAISEFVCCNDSIENKTDFFLNTAHQLRRNKLTVKAYFIDDRLASVASATNISADLSVFTFVYTDEYFRGNGYMKELLSHLCSDSHKKYQLLCEKHNIEFYEKCGFIQQQKLFKFSL